MKIELTKDTKKRLQQLIEIHNMPLDTLIEWMIRTGIDHHFKEPRWELTPKIIWKIE